MAHLVCKDHGKRVIIDDGVAIHRSGTAASEIKCGSQTVTIGGRELRVDEIGKE